MSKPRDIADQVVLLLSLVPYLRDNGPTPVPELAERFDVEPGTMRTLLQFLGTAGIPGETHTYQHEDLFDIDWDALEHHDVAHLITPVAVDDVPRFSPTETAALLAGLHSLTTVLGPADAALAARTAEKIASAFDVSDSSVSVTAEPVDPQVMTVMEGIEQRRTISFTYRDLRGSESSRRVDPIRLSQGADSWYVRAYCHTRSAERTFRLDRMADIEVVTDPDDRPSPWRDHLNANGEFPDETDPIRLRVRLREWVLPSIRGFQPEVIDQRDVPPGSSDHHDNGTGWVRATVEVRYLAAAVHLVQQAPGSIIIEAPPSAVAAISAWADEALTMYGATNA